MPLQQVLAAPAQQAANQPEPDLSQFGPDVNVQNTPAPTKPAQQPQAQPQQAQPQSQEPDLSQFGPDVGGDPASGDDQPGFISTVASDLGGMAKGAIKFALDPSKSPPIAAAKYLQKVASDPEGQKKLYEAQDAHKHEVYKQSADLFHQGHYAKAMSNLVNLFDPKYDDPNDPLNQVMEQQWQSSALARGHFIDDVNNKDYVGAAGHAVAMLPVMSQIDSAMHEWQKNPTRANGAHVLTAILPAFLPTLMKGASKAVGAATEALTPTTETLGDAIPAQEAGAKVSQDIESQERPIAPPDAQTPQEAGKVVHKELHEGKQPLVPEDAPSPQEGGKGVLDELKAKEQPLTISEAARPQEAGQQIQDELRSGEQPIVPGAPSAQDAGGAVQDSMAATREAQGQAVGEAKEAAIPKDFHMVLDPFSELGNTLREVRDKIGGTVEGLSALKDPELDNVREMLDKDLGTSRVRSIDANQVDKIREQLNDKISQQSKAVQSGTTTGTAMRHYNAIKKAFDDEMYGQIQDPHASELLRTANKTFADTVKTQTRGLSKSAVRMQSPEQVILRYARGGPGYQSEVQSIMSQLSPDAKAAFQDGVMKQIIEKNTKGGLTDWTKVGNDIESKGDMAKSLLGDRYDGVMQSIKNNAKFAELKALAPEALITRFVKAGPEMQSETEGLMNELSAPKKQLLRSSVLNSIVDSARTPSGMVNWGKIQDSILSKGDTGKALFGEQYDDIMAKVSNNVQRSEKLGNYMKMSPEKLVMSFVKAGPESLSDVQNVLGELSPTARKTLSDSVLKQIVDSHTDDGSTDWAKVKSDVAAKGDTGKALFGDQYNQIMDRAGNNAQLGDLAKLTPEQLVMRYVRATPEMQTQTQALMRSLSSDARKTLQDSVLKRLRDDAGVGPKSADQILTSIKNMGDTGKELFGSRYSKIVGDLEHNSNLAPLRGKSPEKLIIHLANGGPEIQTETEELMDRLSSPRNQKALQDGVLNHMVEQSGPTGKPDWIKLQEQMQKKDAVMHSLLRDRYKGVMEEVTRNAKNQKITGVAAKVGKWGAPGAAVLLGLGGELHRILTQ